MSNGGKNFCAAFQHQSALGPAHGLTERRTVKYLLAATHAHADERARELNAKRAAEAARQKAKGEADRTQYLNQLAKREDAVWKQVEKYIQKRRLKDYDRAVILMIDLHDPAVRRGQESIFQPSLEKLRKTHAGKETLLRRLTKAKL